MYIEKSREKLGSFDVNYLHAGNESAEPIFLLHGFGIIADYWLPNILEIAEAGFKVYAFDLPGHGESKPPNGIYTIEFYNSVISELVDKLGIHQVSIIGHSMGATIAIKFAMTNPNMVKHLILSDVFGISDGYLPVSSEFATKLLIPATFLSAFNKTQLVIDLVLKLNIYDRNNLPEELHDQIWSGNWMMSGQSQIPIILGMVISLGTAFQRKNFLREFSTCYKINKLPVLILWGDNDRLFSVSQAHKLHDALPGSSMKIFTNCGHAPSLEMAKMFNQNVIGFLS